MSLNSNGIGRLPIRHEAYEFDNESSLVLAGHRYQSEILEMKYDGNDGNEI